MNAGAALALCRRLGLRDEPVFLAVGATCRVYRVGDMVLRSGPARFAVDAELRRALGRLGAPVAAPQAVGEGWSLDSLLAGTALMQISDAQAAQIGAAVAALHSLPVSGWGLLRDQGGPFVAEAPTLPEGIQTRLTDAWPFGTTLLKQHPLMRFAPELLNRLAPLEESLLALADTTPVINHSDLHREQFLFEDRLLSGLLDFGDAVAGPPGWDAASFALFWGWERLPAFLSGYGSPDLEAQARLMAVPLAFHRASRAALDPLRLRRAADYLRAALSASRTPTF
ncbi:phosphotransferase family protein [Deinococcus alpinitundrae]|uniref:phosphotransferase family protein n=1 Tax=Deinococcus alpinitundrae TaxID=468913 RepID=UPI0013796EFE|nr:phosphotransferase [Deinococcus alpinitundrae]